MSPLIMTMTLGDVIVAGTMVVAVVGAYFAVKGNLTALTATVARHDSTIDAHDGTLEVHGLQLAALDTEVFGRRHGDRNKGKM